jgi:phosphotransferase system IIA component
VAIQVIAGTPAVTPKAVDDVISVTPNNGAFPTSATVDASGGVLANDTTTGGPLNAVLVGGSAITTGSGTVNGTYTVTYTQKTAHGSVTLNAVDGSFTYTPDAGYTGQDSFTYQAVDAVSNTASNTATVTLNAGALVSIPQNLTIGTAAGSTVKVPVNIASANPVGSGGLSAVTLGIKYDATKFSVKSVDIGSVLKAAGWTTFVANTSTPGQVNITAGGPAITAVTGGDLADITLQSTGALTAGTSVVNLSGGTATSVVVAGTGTPLVLPFAIAPVDNTSNTPGPLDGLVTIGNVTPVPTITVSPASLDLGTTAPGTAGTGKTYTVGGTLLTAPIVITAPTGVELSSDNGAHYSTTVTLTPASGTVANTTITVRIASTATAGAINAKVTNTSTGATEQDVAVTGTVATTPTITVSATSLDLGTTTQGAAGTGKTLTVSGANLTAPLVITAPTGVELSSDNGASYKTTVTLTPASGTVPNTTITVRIASTAAAGAVTGKVTHVSTGATQQDVNVTGNVTPAGTGTTTTATTSNATPVYGTAVTLTAAVAPASGTTAPTGTVDFLIGTTHNAGTLDHTDPTTHVAFYTFKTGATQLQVNGGQAQTITASFTGTGTFGPSQGTVTETVSAATVRATGITAGNKVYDATTTATLNVTGAGLTGVIGTDIVTLTTSAATGAFASKDVANSITVTITGLTLGGAQAPNYVLGSPVTTTANITPKALTVTGLSASNKVYDATATATLTGTAALPAAEAPGAGSGTDGKPYTGDTVTLGGTATGAFASKDVGNGIAVTVTGNTLGGTQAGNYTLTQQSGLTANITPKSLTVTGLSTSNKVYDATTKATLTGTAALAAGEAPGAGTSTDGKPYTGDTVTLGGTATGTFASKDVGNGIAVSVTGNTLGGTQAGNYVLAANEQPGLTANTTPKALTVTGLSASNKIYDATTTATLTGTAALPGAEAPGAGTSTDGKPYTGDTVTVGGTATGAFASKDVGNGLAVTVTGNTLSGAQGGNYTLTQQTGLTANITPKALTVTGLSASNKVYDATTTATLTGTAALPAAEAPGAGAGTDGKPYTGDTVTLGGTATGVFASKDVGNGLAVTVTGNTLSGAQGGNYTLTQQAGLTANITPKSLTVTGLSASNKVYDATTTATLTGTAALAAGEAPGAGTSTDGKPYTGDTVTLGGTPVGTFASKDVANGIAVSVTGNTLGGTQAGNYVLAANEQAGLTANITPKALTVTGLSASSKVYDATTTATLTGTAGLPAGEAPGAGTSTDGKPYTGDTVTVGGTATGAFASKDVGNGLAVTVTGNTLSGAQGGNYTLTQQTGLTANITPKALTVTGLSASNKVYDATTTATLTGTAALPGAEAPGAGTSTDGKPYTGDTVTLGGTATGAFASKDVGNGIAVTVTGNTLGGTQAGNYTLTQQAGLTANITPKSLTVTGLSASNKIYDATTTATLTGTAALPAGEAPGAGSSSDGKPYTGDTVTVGGTPAGTFASKDVGNGIAVTITGNTLGGTQAGNYTLAQQTGLTANITPKALTVTGLSASNKIYDATTTATLAGTAALPAGEAPGAGSSTDGRPYTGDTVTVGGTATGTFASKDVGNGIAVTVSGNTLGGTQAGNYTLTQQTGLTANITPKSLTVTGLSASNKVYDTTTAATLTGTAALPTAEAPGAGASTDGKPYTGDTVTVGGTPAGTFASKDVANGIAVTVAGNTLGGAQAGNYTLVQQTGLTANITPKALTVTGITAKDKVYDSTTKATLNTGGASLSGVLGTDAVTLNAAAASGDFVSKDVGAGIQVKVSGLVLGGAQAGDYTVTQPTTTANITQATLTVTGVTANDKFFDGNTKATLNTNNAALVGVFSGDSVTLDATNATGTFANAGPNKSIPVTVSGLALTGPQAGDYTLTQPTGLTANITQATSTLPTASFKSTNLNLLEGTSGLTPFTFSVQLSKGNPSKTPITYDIFTNDGTAKAGVNYIAVKAGVNAPNSQGTVTFNPGQVVATVTVYAIGGSFAPTVAAPTKTFTVSLSDPLNPGLALPGSTSTATIIGQTPRPPQLAVGTPTGAPGAALTTNQLAGIVTAAEARWEQTGVPATRFQGVQVQIDNIANAGYHVLGNTSASDKTITIDATAAGFGWFIDPTPMEDREFQATPNSTNLTAVAPAAVGRMDLLTVVEHELGHILGYPDLTSGADTLMSQDLAAGTRRLPIGANAIVSIVPPGAAGLPSGQQQQLNMLNPLPPIQTTVPLPANNHVSSKAIEQAFATVATTQTGHQKPADPVGKDALDKVFGQPGK